MVGKVREQMGSCYGPASGRGAQEGSWWACVGNGETPVLEVQVSVNEGGRSSFCWRGCHRCSCMFCTLKQVLRLEGPAGPNIHILVRSTPSIATFVQLLTKEYRMIV